MDCPYSFLTWKMLDNRSFLLYVVHEKVIYFTEGEKPWVSFNKITGLPRQMNVET